MYSKCNSNDSGSCWPIGQKARVLQLWNNPSYNKSIENIWWGHSCLNTCNVCLRAAQPWPHLMIVYILLTHMSPQMEEHSIIMYPFHEVKKNADRHQRPKCDSNLQSVFRWQRFPSTAWKKRAYYVVSGFRTAVDQNCALLGYYTAVGANSLPTFRDNLSVPSSRVKNPKFFLDSWTSKMGPTGCAETPVRNYHYSMCNNAEGCNS